METEPLNAFDSSKETWLAERKHRVTATKISHLLGGSGVSRFAEMILDIGLGHSHLSSQIEKEIDENLFFWSRPPSPDLPALVWGNTMEEHAFKGWAEATMSQTKHRLCYPGNFVIHPHDDRFGATPDFTIVNEAGRVLWTGEIKCPWLRTPPVHYKDIPKAYVLQVLHQMWVTGADFGLLIYAHFDYAQPDNPTRMRFSQWLFAAPPAEVYERVVINPIRALLSIDRSLLAQALSGAPWVTMRDLSRLCAKVFGQEAALLAQACFLAHDPDVVRARASRSQSHPDARPGPSPFPLLCSTLVYVDGLLVSPSHDGGVARSRLASAFSALPPTDD